MKKVNMNKEEIDKVFTNHEFDMIGEDSVRWEYDSSNWFHGSVVGLDYNCTDCGKGKSILF